MEVYTVTVFESGDFTTSVWGVFDSEEKAEAYKVGLLNSDLNKSGSYLEVTVSKHQVE